MSFEPSPSDALIVVDVQNDFCPGGALAVAGGDAVVPVVNALAARFANVVLTQDWHPAGHVSFAETHGRAPFETVELAYGTQVLWPTHCVQGSSGAEFHPGLCVPHAQAIVRKGFNAAVDSYSGFREADRTTPTGLRGYLGDRGIRRVFVCGLAMDFCVAWTAFDARDAGLEVVVVEDACRGIDLDGSMARSFGEMAERGIARQTAATLG
ncbi:bifunctional nicotinamidase/pyrazinamidase [Aureimonas pseudogalii]|uniref:Nicotinamidase n=1 Tax=Aureimonas pseudogalii TaxID=1744844 RepID=A0A7W6H3N1_9HYPH|nr:bifunctional nicotinamidase/pyrazinamidase [Aureimonas pseudogalii]MBB3998266.1 nicotinamidase/pyrazinamidase [Aureimonas pseudogalii]